MNDIPADRDPLGADPLGAGDLADIARMMAGPKPPSARSEYDRGSLRFNDTFRTVSLQLPPEDYAEARTCLEARARNIYPDEEPSWDQRLCDAFTELILSSWCAPELDGDGPT